MRVSESQNAGLAFGNQVVPAYPHFDEAAKGPPNCLLVALCTQLQISESNNTYRHHIMA
ncbi:hypothetical protein QJS10_CPB14g00076 [Acorus calamus]|uniref:Uncharacterized protein n=1 Tax=Acorus calamus TaxID=4465 RepID=A0AAV9DAY0_ACOCL|nr:hypothetical protein QJS10_CPB14g00076 [Acorus calamus]